MDWWALNTFVFNILCVCMCVYVCVCVCVGGGGGGGGGGNKHLVCTLCIYVTLNCVIVA